MITLSGYKATRNWSTGLYAAVCIFVFFASAVVAAPPAYEGPDLLQPAAGPTAPARGAGVTVSGNSSRHDYRDERVTPSAYNAPDREINRPATVVGTSPARPQEPMPIAHGDDKSLRGAGHREAPAMPSAGPALLSMMASLAVVVGLFLGVAWLVRRAAPGSARLLPGEVVESLGRAPLAGRQQMHLIRFGSKLLLVSLSTAGAETLSEITDPAEVDRLSGICQQTHAQSATGAFRQVLKQFAQDRKLTRSKTDASAPRRREEVDHV